MGKFIWNGSKRQREQASPPRPGSTRPTISRASELDTAEIRVPAARMASVVKSMRRLPYMFAEAPEDGGRASGRKEEGGQQPDHTRLVRVQGGLEKRSVRETKTTPKTPYAKAPQHERAQNHPGSGLA